ncbi:MAG: Riboflavin synthase eubacterial/eukaryotic [uncultured Solirubrobacteraceae bacterium]|uniref:Riboflavin synthase n=1 Tax=uncultured Solirubrobacteraceae bacterium TaxID=1162706 RepID=A0A6J4T965_9ACTN|nr:MAG: Riboflavin synthase eubacterial/eukaryotic [uncultured Solirubrobacteraceae bacterium]
MFTGLVQELGTIEVLTETPDGVRLTVRAECASELTEGDSVAVNGVCLTATRIAGESFAADVMHETLRRSSLRGAGFGTRVNLELPLRASDRLGGHVVQGHVDGTGHVAHIADEGFARLITIEPDDPELLRYVVEKGSIAIDGVSLTVASIDATRLTVSLIPETLERTNLGVAGPGTPVNLEVDVLAKYVEKLVARG